MGRGNSLNIIRVGGHTEQFDIIMCNDLNGCISNLLVTYGGYYDSLTWNSSYPRYNKKDITQYNNIDKNGFIHSG